jgi:hypothetical protein
MWTVTPCRGILVPPRQALDAAWCVEEGYPALLGECALREAGLLDEIAFLERDLDKTLGVLAETRNDLLDLERPFFDHPIFWFALGAIVAVGGTVLTYELLEN